MDAESAEITYAIIGAAMEVHRSLGPGFKERVYQEALAFEMAARGIRAVAWPAVAVVYKGHRLRATYVPDFVVEDQVVLELKTVEALSPLDRAQLLGYLRVTGLRVGLLLNFNTARMAEGILRVVQA